MLTPDQVAEDDACKRLWCAVLTQAVQEAKEGRVAAIKWMEHDVNGDFTAVCEMAGMDADVIKEAVLCRS